MNRPTQTEMPFGGETDTSREEKTVSATPTSRPSASERPLADFAPIVIKAPTMDEVSHSGTKPAQAPPKLQTSAPKPQAQEKAHATTSSYFNSSQSKTDIKTHSTQALQASKYDSYAKSSAAVKIQSTVLPSNPIKTLPTTPMLQTTSSTPPSVSDFRRNAERQAREQKAVGNVLSWVAYGLLGGILMVAALAGFGGYTLWKMIQEQSVTVAQFESAFTEEITTLNGIVQKQDEQLTQMRALAAKQQDQITKVTARADETAAQLRAYKATTDREMADLRGRLRRMEGRP
jgi:hypothetical protein